MELKKGNTEKIEFKVCYGISSATNDNKHVFMADYDTSNFKLVIKDLLRIQNDYHLSHIFVIGSTNGYNAISLDKLTLKAIYDICLSSKYIDKEFGYFNYKRKYYTLRFDNDKTLDNMLFGLDNNYQKSNAHRLFLNWFFKMNLSKNSLPNFDNETNIEIIQYYSKKHGYHIIKDLSRGVSL